ncbi:FadR/GntR family transcriptional regulator [Flavihumibacter solisilvae]|uniref:GntR family transcriptional regulator n=1 Tax=Flavihumibacter solisilvae TaxID=1349421 RepID=A0A0C1LBZ4_9BACT|nr:GntR family transcriptional regulator [Flavihumibacter solisilvae]KIC93023.1 GntR family transcriptional regulator [Flavihumibacter solisilvae]
MQENNLLDSIRPISTQTMAEVVEARLREYFRTQSFKPGDSLPTEVELAQALGVSRNVVREALSRFRMLGIVETKKKKGMTMSNPDILGAFEKVLDPLIIDDVTLQDIFELRLVLETGLADLLYIRKTDKEIEELEKIAVAEKSSNKFRVQNEIAFHGKLYEMTKNNTLKRFQTMLLPIFAYVITQEEKPIRGKVSHMDLVNILKKGTKEDFKEGMLAHLQPHFDRLQKKTPKRPAKI